MNPGALGLPGTLSVYADVTLGLEPPYETGSPISQISLGFNSFFFALAYQLDRLPDPFSATGTVRGHAVRAALWGQYRRIGAAGTATWYTGGDGGVGFDAGVVYRAGRAMDVGAVLANIGQPSVRGTDLPLLIRPAVTLHAAGDLLAVQAQSDIGTDRLWGFAFGTRIRVAMVEVTVRLDTDGELGRQSFSFGLAIGGTNRVGALVTTSGDVRVTDAASLHFSSERSTSAPRR